VYVAGGTRWRIPSKASVYIGKKGTHALEVRNRPSLGAMEEL